MPSRAQGIHQASAVQQAALLLCVYSQSINDKSLQQTQSLNAMGVGRIPFCLLPPSVHSVACRLQGTLLTLALNWL